MKWETAVILVKSAPVLSTRRTRLYDTLLSASVYLPSLIQIIACHQAIIWTIAGILLIQTSGTNFSEILSKIQTFSIKKMHFKMSSAKWYPFCFSLNVLNPIYSAGEAFETDDFDNFGNDDNGLKLIMLNFWPLAGLGSNTFYQIQIQIQIHFFPEFQIQIQIQIHRQKSDQIQIQIQIQLIKYKYKYKYRMRPRQNCRHFTDDILKFIVL